MTQPMKYDSKEPLTAIVDFLEKANKDQLASDVIDVFAANSNNIEQFNLIAKLYLDVRNVEQAEKYALKVLAMSKQVEEMYNARANLAKMYNAINEPAKSMFYSKLNIMIDPDNSDTLLESVFSLYLLGQKPEAEVILRKLKAIEHTLPEHNRDVVNFNLGTYDMEAGDFLKGLGGFLLNIKKLNLWFSPRELPYTYWSGGIYPGRTLIMFMEGGGIGDEFITVRFMDTLKSLGFDPVYYTTRQDLCTMFNRCGYQTVMTLDGLPADSLWTYAMQVPLWLELQPEQITRADHYLFASDQHVNKWSFMKNSPKLKIGVRWQGNAKNERDLHRKVPIEAMMDMLLEVYAAQDVEFYSLQIGDGQEEIIKYPQLIDVSDKITSYEDTLALLQNLDIVISSCTSVLHAAAIVGTKTYGLIPISAYFTWLCPAPDNGSIYYGPNLKVFKQVTFKSWEEPLEALQLELENNAA